MWVIVSSVWYLKLSLTFIVTLETKYTALLHLELNVKKCWFHIKVFQLITSFSPIMFSSTASWTIQLIIFFLKIHFFYYWIDLFCHVGMFCCLERGRKSCVVKGCSGLHVVLRCWMNSKNQSCSFTVFKLLIRRLKSWRKQYTM